MKCFFCAEEIQDAARLCRFCGARLVNGQWQAPETAAPESRPRSSFTIRSSGWLLIISGLWMLFSCTSPVPLFGAVRTGIIALCYNVFFAAALLAMGYALAYRTSWALKATAAASALYTLDKLLFILDGAARRAALADSSRILDSLGGNLGAMADKVAVLMSWAFLAGWWGLVLYIYSKRGYFKPAGAPHRQF